MQVETRVPGHGHSAGLMSVSEVMVAPARSNQSPAIFPKKLNDFAYLHGVIILHGAAEKQGTLVPELRI